MSQNTPPPCSSRNDISDNHLCDISSSEDSSNDENFQDIEQFKQRLAEAKREKKEASRREQALQKALEHERRQKEQAQREAEKAQEEKKRKEEALQRKEEELQQKEVENALLAEKNKRIEEEQRQKEEEEQRRKEEEEKKRKEEEEQKKQKQREEEEARRKEISLNIIKAQSETLDMIKPILQHFPPPKSEGLAKLLSDFFLLNDGHILFSRTWLKNDTDILSTPLLFRPVYIIILHEILKFIEHFFSEGGPKERPGAAFYIAGDQGIGKTSLMLILMSTLSHRSLGFHYEKGFKGSKPRDFQPSKNPNGSFRFDKLVGPERNAIQDLFIHIHDDCPPPEDIEDNHLHIIFTSPDPLRLPIPEKKKKASPDQPQPPSAQKPSPNHLCHIFRLPTFSLAEDAVTMVGCTPTVPFAVLSPEDMQLHTKDQQILLSIEINKEEIAGRLPEASDVKPLPSKNSSVAAQLKTLVGDERVSLTQWKNFSRKFRKEYALREKQKEEERKRKEEEERKRKEEEEQKRKEEEERKRKEEEEENEQKQREEEENKQEELLKANSNIITAQSQTINLIKPVLQHFSPGWTEGLIEPKNEEDTVNKDAELKRKEEAKREEEESTFSKSSTEYAQIENAQKLEIMWRANEAFIREKEEEEKRKEKDNLNINQDKQTDPVNQQTDHFNQIPPPDNKPSHITLQTDVTASTVTDSNEEPAPSGLSSKEIDAIGTANMKPKSEKDTVDEEIDRFYTSLNKRIQNQKEIPDRERIIAVVDWLMEQLEVPSERSQEQAKFIKDLIRKLVLFEWDQSVQKDQDAQNAEATTTAQKTQNEGREGDTDLDETSILLMGTLFEEEGMGTVTEEAEAAQTGENAQNEGREDEPKAEAIITEDVEKGEEEEGKGTVTEEAEAATNGHKDQEEKGNDIVQKIPKPAEEQERERQRVITEKLFEIAESYDQPAPNVIGEIQEFSELIKKVKLTDPQTSPSPEDLTDLTAQLERLKSHLEEPDISEDVNRQKVRDEMTKISKQDGLDDKKRRTLLYNTLIDMLITPPPYDSKKKVLQSLFVLPEEKVKRTDISLRNNIGRLLSDVIDTRNQQSDSQTLAFIVDEMISYLDYSQIDTDPPNSAQSDLTFDKGKMARLACDLLMTIVNPPIAAVDPPHKTANHLLNPVTPPHIQEYPPHIQLETRLEYVQNQIERVHVELSLVSLMDDFFFIAQDMNILVTPHSILKGLSERPEQPKVDLIRERMQVYYGNLRDDGLRDWINKASKTLLPRPDTPEKTPLEEVQLFIGNNLKSIIKKFNKKYKPSECSVINRQWLAIVRSMMNTFLYLIDAGAHRHMILEEYKGLRDLLTTVYKSNQHHLLSVAAYQPKKVVDDDDENAADYVNDMTIFLDHFSTQHPLYFLELPRTLQLAPVSQDRLEQMTIALFARNMLCFLEMENGFWFDDDSCVKQFFTDFLQQLNPGDIVHRSFVDFMNSTGLLSQEHFGLTPDKFTDFLEKEHPELKSKKDSVQTTRETPSLAIMTEEIELKIPDPKQQFKNFLTRQFGVHLLLWASTDLLMKAADAITSQESGDWKTVDRLNMARASIFGPSPRWLTSTDARTNRGLTFLWDGVLESENVEVLMKVANSNHSRIMEFNTPHIFFEKTLNAAWDDITALVPVLPDYRKKEKRPSLLKSAFSLIFKKTAEAIEQMEKQIPFVALSSFVEQIMQSEVVAALARLMTQDRYDTFKNSLTIHGIKLPPYVEEPLVCIAFLLNCPTEIHFSTTTTSFTSKHTPVDKSSLFWSHHPAMETTATKVTTISMLTFPKLSNQSVHGTKFPKSLIQTGRGETHFYAEDLQELEERNLPGLDSLIVSRGSDKSSETIFMPIQATTSKTHSLVQKGVILIQQLLFQAMCHLEPSEPIVAMYNYATTQKEFFFPSRTGILGFHMVSSYLKFDENTLAHMSSILRHRDRPLMSNPSESRPTMTTRFITDTLLANLPQYPTFSTDFDPWITSLSAVNYRNEPNFILPFRWKLLYDLFWKPSTDASPGEAKSPQITMDEKDAKDWKDRMVIRTIQELLRIGVSPNDLGETDTDRIKTFSSFLLCIAISRRRKKLFRCEPMFTPRAQDHHFVKLVRSIVGTSDCQSMVKIVASLSPKTPNNHQINRDAHLQHLDDLCRENCIQSRLYPVYRVMTNNAIKRIRNPIQECLSVIQSKYDTDVFRVPTRNNLSAILHCGTVLLDHIIPSSPSTSTSLSQSKTLKIPLHSFVLAKYGFSNSIPSLCDLTQVDVQKEVTNVTPSPLNQWLPRRVVIDPSLFTPDIQQADSLSYFTIFIHRLFNNPFIPVTTSFLPGHRNRIQDNDDLRTQIGKITKILNTVDLSDHPQLKKIVDNLSDLDQSDHPSAVFSLLSEIRSSLEKFKLNKARKTVVLAALEAIESIVAIRQQPTLVFVKSGNVLFLPSTEDPKIVDQTTQNPKIIVDRETKAHLFPIPFSTGYKKGELREEMKQLYQPLTDLLPDNFPKEHVSLSPPQDGQNKEQKDLTPSRTETESESRAILDAAILRYGGVSTTPLFVFVVDEDLPDHESLPMSLQSSEDNTRCGIMRQRSLADVLSILFMTRISREVMALSLNTSLKPNDFNNYVIKFISQVLMDANKIGKKDTEDCSTIFDTLISLVTQEGFHNLDEHRSIGIELLVSAYPLLQDETSVISLSRLLMMCKSTPEGETRLNTLVNDASPTNELDLLTRWFELLSSSIEKNGFAVPENSGGFTLASIRSNLLNAFYLVIKLEHEHRQPLVNHLSTTISFILNAGTQRFFDERDRQTLHVLQTLASKRIAEIDNMEDTRTNILSKVYVLIGRILDPLEPAKNEPLRA
ncbi:hypothetical protein BLNAU_14756 [Blattamonas nauphoetae]|uniref:Uncharacterized protein n=1 Tax=Blattamonas nauphoetae TaxID=2049346 RepID=A0ABQ9XFZ5_9EUKA|nr:hypothetical protein BLNAU_14756 [Blattamonas nauphoetae]